MGPRSPARKQVDRLSLPPPTTNVYVPLTTYLKACEVATALAGFDYKGRNWGTDFAAQRGGYSHIMMPNRKACLFQGEPQTLEWRTVGVGASSFHPGGVNVGFLDGSVRFVTETVAPRTWWAIAPLAEGEFIDVGSL
jgi:prepilin-type processing-associated H-X9-DG protein